MSTFTWIPDIGSTEERAPRIRSVQFGDGYEQRAQDGINADMRKRSLSFTARSSAESTAILAFLEAQGGTASFDYTHPGDSSRKYVCKSWKATDTGYLLKTITAEFQEVPL
jgi:phage-related protein